MPRSKKTEPPELPPWVDLPAELYAEAIPGLVHFSLKTCNSNIPAGGVRLAPKHKLDLPYVSARTLLHAGEDLALDYMANSGKTATVVKQLHQLESGHCSAPAEEAEQLKQLLTDIRRTSFESGTDAVSVRARQIQIPCDGSYVGMTPISAGAVNRSLQEKRQEHEDLRRAQDSSHPVTLQRIPTAVFGLGGANPQNVGALVRNMQRPLVFFAPTEHRQIKAALALYFKGSRIRLSYRLLGEYRSWRTCAMAANGGKLPSNLAAREEERGHIERIASAILRRGEADRHQLLAHQDVLPGKGSPLVSSSASVLARGLTDPGQMDRDWPRLFATEVTRKMIDFRFKDGQGEFDFDQHDRNQLLAIFEELAR